MFDSREQIRFGDNDERYQLDAKIMVYYHKLIMSWMVGQVPTRKEIQAQWTAMQGTFKMRKPMAPSKT